MSNPIDDALSHWSLNDPGVSATLRPWFPLNPMRLDAAFDVLAKLPNHETRLDAIGNSRRLTQNEKAALFVRNHLLPVNRPG